MRTLLGIDIGTSSLKVMLLDISSSAMYVKRRKYSVSIPKENCAEQDPDLWWNELIEICREFKQDPNTKEGFEAVSGIGFSGQMHGLVCVDDKGSPIRPAIIWLDHRADEELKDIYFNISDADIRQRIHNRICAGFAFPSLLWIKKNESENYIKIHTIFQPKDYIRFRMTGEIGTDVTDASATGIYDVGKRDWAWDIIQKFKLNSSIFPKSHESIEIAGYVSADCAAATGLKEGIPVIYGCGDQMAQSIGNGVYKEGKLISNIGTGGQVSAFSKKFIADEKMRTNTFCHAVLGGYSVFGATLNSGNSLNWLCDKILGMDNEKFAECTRLAGEISAGSEGIIYLPYLTGERTPVMNNRAKGIYFGLKLQHDKRHLIRATMEGIIYSLKDCLSILQQLGINSNQIIASGGGAGSELFLQLQADIFEKEMKVCRVSEQACLGACILAGAGIKAFTLDDATEQYVDFDERIIAPIEKNIKVYREGFEIYHEIYNNTKKLMEVNYGHI
jgi:xylulokinase